MVYVEDRFGPLFLQKAIDKGLRCFDTASEYMQGQSECILGQAVKHVRQEAVIVTKFLPEQAHMVIRSCEDSLRRLSTDHIDLFLLHAYDTNIDLDTLINDLTALKQSGKILQWGVCNTSSQMLDEIAAKTNDCYAHQLWHSPVVNQHVTISKNQQLGIKTMAHSVLKNRDRQGLWINDHAYQDYCKKNDIDPAALAISWACQQDDALPIVTTKNIDHLSAGMTSLQEHREHYHVIDELYGQQHDI